MSYKKASFVALLCLLAVGISFLVIASNWTYRTSLQNVVSPKLYPMGLCTILIVLCVISLFQTWRRKEDHVIPLPNVKRTLSTIGLTVAFLLAWRNIGYFYVFLALYIFLLLFVYQSREQFRKIWWANLIYAGIIVGFVWFLFDYILKIRI